MTDLKRILFIGRHTDLYEVIADFINVEAVCVDSEDKAAALLGMVDGVVTGHVGRSHAWFDLLQAKHLPCVVFSALIQNRDEFKANFPRLKIVDKGLGSEDVRKLIASLCLYSSNY